MCDVPRMARECRVHGIPAPRLRFPTLDFCKFTLTWLIPSFSSNSGAVPVGVCEVN